MTKIFGCDFLKFKSLWFGIAFCKKKIVPEIVLCSIDAPMREIFSKMMWSLFKVSLLFYFGPDPTL
jgi:hypothetical protein